MRLRGAWGLGFALVGCAEPRGEVLEPRCGSDDAVKLVDLGAGEQVNFVGRFDDARLRVVIGSTEGGAEGPERVVLVSECGGAPEPVASSMRSVFEVDGELYGCDPSHALVKPSGLDDPAPLVLAEGGCAVQRTELGLVARDSPAGAELGRIVSIRPTGTGEVAVETLLDGVRVTSPSLGSLRTVVRHVFAQMPDDTLVRVDVVSGVTDVVAEAVLEFMASSEYVLYRRIDALPDGRAAVVLLDLDGGRETVLDYALPTAVSMAVFEEVIVLGWPWSNLQSWFWLEDGVRIVPPVGTRILSPGDDRMFWLASVEDASRRFEILRWREGEAAESVFSCRSCEGVGYDVGGGLEFVVYRDFEPETLWFADGMGGAAERITGPVGELHVRLDDGRVLTQVEHDVPGPLLLYDGRGDAVRTVVDDALPSATFLTSMLHAGAERDVVYELDSPGDHALYIARLAEVE